MDTDKYGTSSYGSMKVRWNGHSKISCWIIALRYTMRLHALFLLDSLAHGLCVCLVSLELPGRSVLQEHLIELLVCASDSLRLVEPEIDQAEE